MAELKKEVVKTLNYTDLTINKVEDDSVIVNVEGWRMRVYFDKGFKGDLAKGGVINVSYYGELDNPHEVKFQKIK